LEKGNEKEEKETENEPSGRKGGNDVALRRIENRNGRNEEGTRM
jgi:hypothetical protein